MSPGLQVTPPPPVPKVRSKWGSAKSLTNLIILGLWVSLLIMPGGFINLYVFGGVAFDNDTLAIAWAAAGIGSLYGGVFLWAIIAQVLILKKDVGWLALVPLWLLTPLLQIAWVFAYEWAGAKYGIVCC